MKRQLLVFSFFLVYSFTSAQDARDIVRRADEKSRGNTSIAEISMKVVRPAWTREMQMKAWTKGNKLAMILVLAPAKEKGVVYLKKDREVWNWIPSIERNVKLPPSMMSQSWMGTDFTNDDLVKEFSIVEDYTHSLKGEETITDRDCYRIEMTPKPEAAVVWSRVMLWIDKKDLIMMKAEYFDDENMLVNRMIATEVKMLGGRMLPSVMEMIPMEKKGQKTIITYKSVMFDQAINDNFFSVQQMQKMP
jgi:outer membrane lipoprotein-sorting protein